MQYALVDHQRIEARPKKRGKCEMCGSLLIAKCGSRKLHHWAHFRERNCDPWWENETQWHRDWKNLFPKECREIYHVADDGEIHRADIKSSTGIYIEVQHSSMTDQEREARENFYKNMIWIVDGTPFKNNFDIYHMLPPPNSKMAKDIVWAKAKRHMNGANAGMFFRLSDNPKETKATLKGGLLHSMREVKEELENAYDGHHQYDWVRPRGTWLDSKVPVFIDFGDCYVVQLMTYDESKLRCVRLVSKQKLVHDINTETKADNIATRFYKIEK